MNKRIVFICVLLMSSFLLASQFNGKMILRVDGHDHPIPDIFGQYFVDTYTDMRDTLEGKVEGEGNWVAKIKDVRLNEQVSRINYSDDADPDVFRMVCKINDNEIFIKSLGVYKFIFDLKLNITAERLVDSLGLVVQITDANYTLCDIKSDNSILVDSRINSLINFIDLLVPDLFTGEIESKEGLNFTLIPLSTFNGQSADSIISQVDPITEATRILQSVPFDINFNYINYDVITDYAHGFTETYQALVINLDLLPGYYESGSCNNKYINSEPDPVTDPTLDWGGFGLNSSSVFDRMLRRYPTLNHQQLIDKTFEIVADTMKLNHIRIDAVWKEIDPSIPDTTSLDPDDITMTNVNNYINSIENEGGWDDISYVISSAVNHGLIPYVIVGSGHDDEVPSYSGLKIAPGDSVRSNNSTKLAQYIAIPKSA